MEKLSKAVKVFLFVFILLVFVLSSGKIFNYEIFGTKTVSENVIENSSIDVCSGLLENLVDGFSYYTFDEKQDCYFVYDSNEKLLAYVLFSSPYCDEIKGFGGCVPLAIIFNKDDKIKEVVLLENAETKSWVDRLEKNDFFKTWTGVSAKEAIEMNVDAVSGATLTSTAVIKSVNFRLSEYLSVASVIKKASVINIIGVVASFLVLLLALYSFFVPQNSKMLRFALILSSIGVLGFWQGDFLSIALLHNWLINGFDIGAQIFLFIVLILSIILPLITNKSFYCQYLCPFGAMQELVGKVNNKKFALDNKITKVLKILKYVFLIIITLMLVVAVDVKLESLEPFSAFKYQYASLGVLILAVVIMFLSIFITKPWCRFLCPTGALLGLLRGGYQKSKYKKINIYLLSNIILLLVIILLSYLLINKPQQETINKDNETVKVKDMVSVIHNRKSVRNYTDQPVSKEQLELLVKAGMAAPSARNLQPWAFVVVQDRNVLNSLADSLPYAKMLKTAQAAIVVCGDLSKAATDVDQSYWVQDCSAATQNILLAAEAIGLGAVWTAAYPYQERISPIIRYLELPEHIIPLNIIPIGYPTGEDMPKDKWKIENIRWEKW